MRAKAEVGNGCPQNKSHGQVLKIEHPWKLEASSFEIYILGRKMNFLIKIGTGKMSSFEKGRTVNQRQQGLLISYKVGWKRNKGGCLILCPPSVAVS